jgi:hypothetical protein
MAPRDHPPAAGAFTPQTDQPSFIDMGHSEFPEDLFHPEIDILGQMVFNHKEARQLLGLEKGIRNRISL